MSTERSDSEPLLDAVEGLPASAFTLPEPPGHLRDAVWRQTAPRVRGHVRRRRALVLGALVAAYGLGLGTFHLMGAKPTPPATPALVARQMPAPQVVEVAQAAPPLTAGDPLPRQLLLDPEALACHIAAVPKEQRAALLELAGRRFLADLGDIKRAAECYGAALDMARGTDQIQRNANDDWLLASLKEARMQEMHHVDSNA